MIKNWQNSRHSPFLIFSEEARIYQCFINFFLSFFYNFFIFQGNKGKWIKTINKWWKMIKKMIKNWKKLETFTIFDFFRRGQNLSLFINFLSIFIIFQGNRGKWIKTIKKWWKMIKKWKKWKNSRHSPILIVSEAAQNLYFFSQCFIDFLSFFLSFSKETEENE